MSSLYSLILFLLSCLSNMLVPSQALMLSCHREEKFVKVSQDGLPTLSAIKVTTATRATFCSTECLDHPGCQSIVFDASKSEDNCMLSSEANGASSNGAAVTYVKESKVEKMCDANPCQNRGTCSDTCEDPYYVCSCLPTYFKGEICEENTRCDTNPCQNNGTCVTQSSSPYYNCSCKTWFSGTDCQLSTNTDCTQYTLLTDTRNMNTPCCSTQPCDNHLGVGWYRIGGEGGTQLATSCVPPYKCGSYATGWMNGAHPAHGEGMVTRTVCYNYSGNCCNWSNTIRVLNCIDYFLYELRVPPTCHLKYCGTTL